MENRGFRRPREIRLSSAGAFRAVLENGVSSRGPFFRLSVLDAKTGRESSLGIITSRKVGNAVTRSRLRRKFREIHRLSRPLLRDGLWVVLIVFKEAAGATYGELHKEWVRLGNKLAIFKKP